MAVTVQETCTPASLCRRRLFTVRRRPGKVFGGSHGPDLLSRDRRPQVCIRVPPVQGLKASTAVRRELCMDEFVRRREVTASTRVGENRSVGARGQQRWDAPPLAQAGEDNPPHVARLVPTGLDGVQHSRRGRTRAPGHHSKVAVADHVPVPITAPHRSEADRCSGNSQLKS